MMALMADIPDTIVTTCGITSIKHSPGDARQGDTLLKNPKKK